MGCQAYRTREEVRKPRKYRRFSRRKRTTTKRLIAGGTILLVVAGSVLFLRRRRVSVPKPRVAPISH